MMYQPPSLGDYTGSAYNPNGTSNFNPGTPSDKDQEDYIEKQKKQQQDFASQYGIGSSGGGSSTLHQLGTTAAMAGASALAGGAGASGAASAILGAL